MGGRLAYDVERLMFLPATWGGIDTRGVMAAAQSQRQKPFVPVTGG